MLNWPQGAGAPLLACERSRNNCYRMRTCHWTKLSCARSTKSTMIPLHLQSFSFSPSFLGANNALMLRLTEVSTGEQRHGPIHQAAVKRDIAKHAVCKAYSTFHNVSPVSLELRAQWLQRTTPQVSCSTFST